MTLPQMRQHTIPADSDTFFLFRWKIDRKRLPDSTGRGVQVGNLLIRRNLHLMLHKKNSIKRGANHGMEHFRNKPRHFFERWYFGSDKFHYRSREQQCADPHLPIPEIRMDGIYH